MADLERSDEESQLHGGTESQPENLAPGNTPSSSPSKKKKDLIEGVEPLCLHKMNTPWGGAVGPASQKVELNFQTLGKFTTERIAEIQDQITVLTKELFELTVRFNDGMVAIGDEAMHKVLGPDAISNQMGAPPNDPRVDRIIEQLAQPAKRDPRIDEIIMHCNGLTNLVARLGAERDDQKQELADARAREAALHTTLDNSIANVESRYKAAMSDLERRLRSELQAREDDQPRRKIPRTEPTQSGPRQTLATQPPVQTAFQHAAPATLMALPTQHVHGPHAMLGQAQMPQQAQQQYPIRAHAEVPMRHSGSVRVVGPGNWNDNDAVVRAQVEALLVPYPDRAHILINAAVSRHRSRPEYVHIGFTNARAAAEFEQAWNSVIRTPSASVLPKN